VSELPGFDPRRRPKLASVTFGAHVGTQACLADESDYAPERHNRFVGTLRESGCLSLWKGTMW
jgi:hypothetical protein